MRNLLVVHGGGSGIMSLPSIRLCGHLLFLQFSRNCCQMLLLLAAVCISPLSFVFFVISLIPNHSQSSSRETKH